MKREIVCIDCQAPLPGLFANSEQEQEIGPPEFHSFVRGRLRFDVICDHCAVKLNKDDEAFAVSIWIGINPAPHWPAEFLITRDAGATLLEVALFLLVFAAIMASLGTFGIIARQAIEHLQSIGACIQALLECRNI